MQGRREHRSRVTLMQIAPPSRGQVAQYRALRRELEGLAGHINGKLAEFDWVPIRYLNKTFARNTLAGFYRLARIGLVTPLRDGMNLVAKEYVAAQDGNDPGVLVLSRFAGAARELDAALIVNPFDVEAIAEAMHRGLIMPIEERRARWSHMMDVLRENTVARWREDYLRALQGGSQTLAAA
jgi:trehalose 6-phosphate synthase